MNIVYNASAGTGKTYQVVHLYKQLVLEDGIDPREILLMTFTDNAAAELRMRVTHLLLDAQRAAEAKDDGEQVEKIVAALSRLPSAPIGTIHSYCTRLLREHALEAGLSPDFSVLGEEDRTELLNHICRDELLKQLESDPDFKAFCAGTQIIGTPGGFGSSITETVPKLIDQASSLGISLHHAERMLSEPQLPVSIIEFETICRELGALGKRSKKVEEAFVTLQNCLENTNEPSILIEQFNQSFSGHFSYGEAKSIYPRFKELKEEATAREQYRKRHPAAKAFARYVQIVAIRFHECKHAMDAIDFDDQLRMAAELLASGKAKPEFQYVIVDEVQDTARIQCELIQSLWGPENNLVICGDKKQSIYTWRGADPQVMPDLVAGIIKRGNAETIPLQTSYRSKKTILDVVNKLFTSVYDDTDYTETDHLLPNEAFTTNHEKPCIEFLSSDHDEALSKSEKVTAEMEAISNRIQLLIDGPSEWQPNYRYVNEFKPTSDNNAYRYSDILILLRRTTHQSALEQALKHAGIPYTLGGKGRGLFTRQEVRDVSLFLNVITNPTDAFSLIGFLRSPWVGFSDETIAEIAWSKSGFSVDNLLWHFAPANADKTQSEASSDEATIEASGNVCTKSGAPRSFGAACSSEEQILFAQQVILKYRTLLGTKLASELVRMLIEETGYDALLSGLPRGTQRLANLRKILDWLRDTERGAQVTPLTVARKLAQQIKDPPQVPEAALLDPAQNAVTIMTVHGAKGLTKRVVFMPDISFRPDADRSFAQVYFDDFATPKRIPTLGVRITAPDKSSALSPGFKSANHRAKAARDHELKNLFYVAMTRARDLVVTSASVGKNPEGWLKQMEPLIGNDIPAIPYSTINSAVEKTILIETTLPTANELVAALETLQTPPERPRLQRIPATRLAKEQDKIEDIVQVDDSVVQSAEHAAALGSLGHAVLEQLVLNTWEGSVTDWLDKLRDEFGIGETEANTLQERIEQTRELMRVLTEDMQDIRPEFPFVLHEGNNLIDGTIDLLCQNRNGFVIYDYKFTEANDASLVETYRAQMEIYCKAAEKVYPDSEKADVQLVVVSRHKPRLVSI